MSARIFPDLHAFGVYLSDNYVTEYYIRTILVLVSTKNARHLCGTINPQVEEIKRPRIRD